MPRLITLLLVLLSAVSLGLAQNTISLQDSELGSLIVGKTTRLSLSGDNLDHLATASFEIIRVDQNCEATKAPCPVATITSKTKDKLSVVVVTDVRTPLGIYELRLSPESGYTLDSSAQNVEVAVKRPATCTAISPKNLLTSDDIYCSVSILGWNEARDSFGGSMADRYIFVEATVTNLATDKDLFIVGMNIDFEGRYNTDPRDSEILAESGKRANYFAGMNLLNRSMIFVNGLIGSIAPTEFAPEELGLANNQLSAFIPAFGKFMPDRTARQLELFVQKTFSHSTAVIRRNNDSRSFEIPVEQRLFLTKEERKQLRKYQTGCGNKTCANASAPLIANLQRDLRLTLVATGIRGVDEKPLEEAVANPPVATGAQPTVNPPPPANTSRQPSSTGAQQSQQGNTPPTPPKAKARDTRVTPQPLSSPNQ